MGKQGAKQGLSVIIISYICRKVGRVVLSARTKKKFKSLKWSSFNFGSTSRHRLMLHLKCTNQIFFQPVRTMYPHFDRPTEPIAKCPICAFTYLQRELEEHGVLCASRAFKR